MCKLKILRNLGLVSWGGLIVGKENGWIGRQDIAEYCDYVLNAGMDQNAVDLIVLAGASESEFMGALYKIAGSFDSSYELDKWRLAFLLSIQHSNENESDKIARLQVVYSDFDYPEDMSACSVYSRESGDPLIAMKGVIISLARKLGVDDFPQNAIRNELENDESQAGAK